jgi:hypothetical protein
MTRLTRRQVLCGSGTVAACAVLGGSRRAWAQPRAKIREITVISHQREYYHGWPTLARRRNGQLLLSYSGGREQHVCPFGRVELMQSDDDGRTWGWPRVLLDSAIDDRDSGVLETAKGSILVTTFTSLAYEWDLARAERLKPGQSGAWPPERLNRWRAAHYRLSAAQRRAELGEWMIRSTDGGVTWSVRYPTIVNSPHGPVQLSDGRLLYAGKELWTGKGRNGVCQSTDDGQTWSRPHPIGVWGLPSHLLRLTENRLLMTYGHRRPPFGSQARVSSDHGRTWSEPLTVSADGITGDLGYPSTVQLADGSLLTVWYEVMKGNPRAVLRQAHWALEG